VAEVDGQQVEKPTTVANDETKRFRGGRPINSAQMEERVTAAYNLMLEGGSRRSNAAALSSRFNVSIRQADNYITQAQALTEGGLQRRKRRNVEPSECDADDCHP
jgi:type IV secretory pathway VirD2 relaxase